jgi:hypothetical protein
MVVDGTGTCGFNATSVLTLKLAVCVQNPKCGDVAQKRTDDFSRGSAKHAGWIGPHRKQTGIQTVASLDDDYGNSAKKSRSIKE